MLVSVIYTWVYNHNGRSILTAILLHFVWNSADTILVGIGDDALSLEIATILLAAVVEAAAIVPRSGLAGSKQTRGPTKPARRPEPAIRS